MYKKWWLWVVVVIAILLIVFLAWKVISSYQPVNPVVVNNSDMPVDKPIECSSGYVLKNGKCEVVNVINNTPVNNTKPVVNKTIVIPPVVDSSSIGNFLLTIKAATPQYRAGKDVTIVYTLQNKDNKSITIPVNTPIDVQVKDNGGKILEYNNGTGSTSYFVSETVNLQPLEKKSLNLVIGGNDYDLTHNYGTDGSFDPIMLSIGEVQSNRVIIRILR